MAGDAAHIHRPTGAQGMNTGVRDALALAWRVALAVQGVAADGLLPSYDTERRPVGEEVVHRTVRHAREGCESEDRRGLPHVGDRPPRDVERDSAAAVTSCAPMAMSASARAACASTSWPPTSRWSSREGPEHRERTPIGDMPNPRRERPSTLWWRR